MGGLSVSNVLYMAWRIVLLLGESGRHGTGTVYQGYFQILRLSSDLDGFHHSRLSVVQDAGFESPGMRGSLRKRRICSASEKQLS